MNAPEIIEALEHCRTSWTNKCKGCPYRHREIFKSCSANLMADAKKLIVEQQKLIAKFAKKMMDE